MVQAIQNVTRMGTTRRCTTKVTKQRHSYNTWTCQRFHRSTRLPQTLHQVQNILIFSNAPTAGHTSDLTRGNPILPRCGAHHALTYHTQLHLHTPHSCSVWRAAGSWSCPHVISIEAHGRIYVVRYDSSTITHPITGHSRSHARVKLLLLTRTC